MSLLDVLLDRPRRAHTPGDADTYDPQTIVRQTDGVCDLLYHQSYAERCGRDGLSACSAWLHEHMDALGVRRVDHERLLILAKYRYQDRSFRDLPRS